MKNEENPWPVYKELLHKKKFQEKIEKAYKILESCILCPRNCKVNRLKEEKGFCGADEKLLVSSYGPHYGEESPLVGRGGSGTIFLTNCNLKCIFCQNYDISHQAGGIAKSPEQLADIMTGLEEGGCHNINFVTPTHYMPQIIKGIKIAAERGMKVPIVWNCGGYENPDMIKLLEGIVDIYMPDFKFWEEEVSEKLVGAKDYREMACQSLKEMHRQVGDLIIDERGLAKRGILLRHLVMPENMAGTEKVMKFIAEEISTDTYVNIMNQYRPCFRAHEVEKIDRRPTAKEFKEAVEIAKKQGITRLDRREDRVAFLRILDYL